MIESMRAPRTSWPGLMTAWSDGLAADATPGVDCIADARPGPAAPGPLRGFAISPPIASGPEPPATRAARQARYSRSVSYPGGPNTAPAVVTAIRLIELNPYGRWTVNMATSSTAAMG